MLQRRGVLAAIVAALAVAGLPLAAVAQDKTITVFAAASMKDVRRAETEQRAFYLDIGNGDGLVLCCAVRHGAYTFCRGETTLNSAMVKEDQTPLPPLEVAA